MNQPGNPVRSFSPAASAPIIRACGLHKRFPLGGLPGRRCWLHAVNGADLAVRPGETLGLVGESGCGKSTVGNMLLGLLQPDEGHIEFHGRDLRELTRSRQDRAELARIQAVFQDPQSSLDPRMTVERLVSAPLLPFSGLSRAARAERVRSMLSEVGLGEDHLRRYPHEFSGGQRQRIGIARALVVEPAFLVLDEPTSALDVSVQAQILNLLRSLQARHGYACLFISHDLAVVRHASHRVAVMYLGRVVESAPRDAIFGQPLHPYTRALMAAAPEPDPTRRKPLAVLQGDVPSPVHLPDGCAFHPRCPEAADICRRKRPDPVCMDAAGADGLEEAMARHTVACWIYRDRPGVIAGHIDHNSGP